MHNFVFQNPTKVIFGKDTLHLAGPEACAYGKRILLVYGQSSAQGSGLLEQVKGSLERSGAYVVEFGNVRPNPTLDHVQKGIQLSKKEKIETICALGGGSVIDTAKAISAGAVVEHDVWKFFTGKKSVKGTLPLIAMSTLAASGSEMNSGMVLTNQQTRQKFGFGHRLLFPRVAIMDPQTTYTVPANYTAYGAIDALSHLLEFYMTTVEGYTIVQDRYMEGLALSIIESCDKALVSPEDYNARAALMWSAALALNGLSVAGLGRVGFPMHLIEHSLSAVYDVPHGAGLGVIVPGWLRYNINYIPDRMLQFFQRVLGVTGTGTAAMERGIDILAAWFVKIGAPITLDQLDIDDSNISMLAENALPLAQVWRMRDYNQEKIESILRLCLVRAK